MCSTDQSTTGCTQSALDDNISDDDGNGGGTDGDVNDHFQASYLLIDGVNNNDDDSHPR